MVLGLCKLGHEIKPGIMNVVYRILIDVIIAYGNAFLTYSQLNRLNYKREVI